GAGIKPHVENVVFFAPFSPAASAFRAWRQQFLRGVRVPRVGALALKKRQHVAECLAILKLFAAPFTSKHDQRDAPKTLTRNAPVGPLGDHVADARFTPRRFPLHLGDFGYSFLPQAA